MTTLFDGVGKAIQAILAAQGEARMLADDLLVAVCGNTAETLAHNVRSSHRPGTKPVLKA